jgi:hypothetical protein
MLLLNNIENGVDPFKSCLIPNLGSVVAVREKDSNQAIVGLDLLVLDSHNEVLLAKGVNGAINNGVVLLSNALQDIFSLSLEANML